MSTITPAERVKSRGGRYARALGIDLGAPDRGESFKWLVAVLLYGTRISESLATRTSARVREGLRLRRLASRHHAG